MVYPSDFHRLVLLGTQYGDTFATGLSIAADGTGDMDHVSDTLLDAVAALVGDWWNDTGAAGIQVSGNAKLTGIKLNVIDQDGRYKHPFTMEHVFPTPIAGGGPTAGYPPQLAVVATLRTTVERGLASKGRMYLPVVQGFAQTAVDGRAAVGDAQRTANAVVDLISRLNVIYNSPPGVGTPGHVAVMSNVGSGLERAVTHVTVGRVTDTVRSRRNRLLEDPQRSTGDVASV